MIRLVLLLIQSGSKSDRQHSQPRHFWEYQYGAGKVSLLVTEKQSRAGILLLFGLGAPITGRLAPAVSDERTNQGQAKSNS